MTLARNLTAAVLALGLYLIANAVIAGFVQCEAAGTCPRSAQ